MSTFGNWGNEEARKQLTPNWETTGVVDAVDAEKGTITLWMSDFDELQVVPISPAMPEWLLKPETWFIVKISRECVRRRSLDGVVWGEFMPQPYADLLDKELWEQLQEKFNGKTE
jgi:hypothetical protein